jgi:predicted dehydrogenase
LACTADHTCLPGWQGCLCTKTGFLTIKEALKMKQVADSTGRMVQVGSQQRSSAEFQKAIELVQSGAIGHVEKIYAKVGDPPTPLNLPETPIPGNLNWNLWLGPLNDSKIHYHPDLAPPISLNPEQNETLWGAWRWYLETGNGYTADWGAHMFDIAQAAIGMDGSGPVLMTPKGYNGTQYMTFNYANGIVMTEQPYLDDVPTAQGIKFIGTDGWIEVARGYIACSKPNLIPAEIAGNRPQPRAAQPPQPQQQQQTQRQQTSRNQPAPQAAQLQFEISSPHMQDFIDSVRSRKQPIASIHVGASTAVLCCLGNIANELKRPVKWNPATNCFVDDPEAAAHRLMHYEYRGAYKL